MNIFDFQKMKKNHQKISMITCYDYTSARILSQTNTHCLLVGDSVAMTMHGFKNTLSATVEMMCMHTAAVHRGAPNHFIVSDLPFLSYRQSQRDSVLASQKLMQAGASALKLESVDGNEKIIQHLVASGVPIMGHIGLTPQLFHTLGGYKIQGKTDAVANRLKTEALRLQELGCFSIVLECVPAALAKEITESLMIPTIGIGAGPSTDGQVLVWQDLLGLNLDFNPTFSKAFLSGSELIKSSVNDYIQQIQSGAFPSHEHCF